MAFSLRTVLMKICGITVLLALVLMPLGGIGDSFAEADEIFQTMPINPDFFEFWENPPETFYGKLPPPVDLSYLKDIPVERVKALLKSLPSTFDWRTQGKVTPVEDQNPCGTCWAFGTLAAVESRVLIGDNVPYAPSQHDFSEQNLVCCTDPSWVYLHPDRCMAGGLSWIAMDTLSKKGTRLEQCQPYNTDTINAEACDDSCTSIKRLTGYRLVANSAGMIDEVKNAIYNYGPVSMSYYHDNSRIYPGFIYYWPNCTETTNHTVCIVGWDDTIAHPAGGGYGAWIVKNSWGASGGSFGGNDGYFYLCYGSANMDDVVSYRYEDCDPNETLYYWDETPLVGYGLGAGIDSLWGANVFIAEQSGTLSTVEFWTTSNNAAYEIHVYLDGDISNGLQNEVASQTGACQELGYYSIPLTSPVPLIIGQQFTLAVKMTTPDHNFPMPAEWQVIGECEPPIQTGVSFLSVDGDSWVDTADVLDANVCLRAKITSAAPNNPPNMPSNPSPANHATGVSIDADLSWTGGDPDPGDTVTYDVYFGTTPTPPLVSTNQSATSYDPGTLSYNTKYYWKIVARDNHGATRTGPVWDFTTGGVVGEPDITVSPTGFEKTLPPNTTWNGTLTISNDGGADLTYDISDRGTTGGSMVEAEQQGPVAAGIKGQLRQLKPSQPMSLAMPASVSEIAYDDGVADDAWAWESAGPGGPVWAVRFTPQSYPADLETARVCLSDEWPDADHEKFIIRVYDDDGAGGAPGSSLGATTGGPATSWGWWDVDISGLGITINDGDFYIGYRQLTDWPNCEGLCIDYTDPDGRSWLWYGGEWYQLPVDPIQAGDWMIRCEVEVAEANNPPNTPSNPSPANHATGVSIGADLSWSGGDPDAGDTVTYDVYFGSSASPPLVSNDQTGTTYDPGPLSYSTKYYWKIAARDNHGATATGPVWDFTTVTTEGDCPWLEESPKLGSVEPGSSDWITVTISTTGLANGDYTAEIVIANNDPDEDPTIVPVTLHVGPVEATATATRTIAIKTLAPGESTLITVDVYSAETQPLILDEDPLVGWGVTLVDADGATYNGADVKWFWSSVATGETKTVQYQLMVPLDAPEQTYMVNGVLKTSAAEWAIGGDNTITVGSGILDYYRGLDGDPTDVSDEDLLQAAYDWANHITPSGFDQSLTDLELLALAYEWAS